ncbi:hypothetical protein HYH02_008868 [Chlamydomonas schloesseri]|uniref:Uncharacterized protein n=1 Tax=Chlamydomonas schloesseri TaxID=2026947 RepID=A0A836B1Z8_9CHLO|nr:hypothetical protein HYH02_008868 [Chlamydomonas schloesseri]|eukprot:KAG2444998.1 hypothetical protein HYH02_008868 [Chlamydomonas schloesseri]
MHSTALSSWQVARQLHCGSAVLQPADAPSGSGSGDAGKEAGGSAKAPEQTVTNPLAAALASAAAAGPAASSAGSASGDGSAAADGGAGGLAQASQAAAGRGRRQSRNWMWYDVGDEREERRKERQRLAWALGDGPGAEAEMGLAHLLDVPQSMKKMQRIVKLVRGLPYADAVAQCTLVPHKAARYTLQALEAAHEDATQAKGLDPERLVVGTVYVTRGRYERGISYHAKGRPGANTFHRSHLRVVLNQTAERPAPFARVVAPLMSRRSSAAGLPRPRFAYRTEV